MPGMSEVFEWYNTFEPTNLSNDDRFSFQQLYEAIIPQAQKDGALKTLRINAESTSNDLEKAELKANLGKYYYQVRNYEAAIVYLNESEMVCEKKSHRFAIVNWMKGIVHWKMNENIKAHANWKVAIDTFEVLRDLSRSAKSASKVLWYSDKLESMRVEITKTVEEAFYWLNKWDKSSLDDRANLFVKEIENRIKKSEYPSAFEIGMGLGRISKLRLNPVESAEASIVIGLKYHRMGQSKLAADYFQRAGASFTPRHYQQGVTRWMLGAAQWDLRNERENAFKNWREAIEIFKEVMDQTDRVNDQKKRAWLEIQIKLMERALDFKTRELMNNV